MSFKLKRRDSEGAAPDAPKEESGGKKKYSVGAYMCLLFAVVLVLVVMSYFVQQRNHTITLDSLLEQQDNVTSQAFANIEKLQDTNIQLMEENEALSEEVEELKEQAEALESEKAALESAKNDAENELYALKELYKLQKAIDSGDIEAAEKQVTAVKKSALSGDYKAKFDALCNELELLKNPPLTEEETETEKEEE